VREAAEATDAPEAVRKIVAELADALTPNA
jgi:hypothetical protein